jgi:hypothetical protein
LFIQRWVAAILLWSVGISTLLASVSAFQESENIRQGIFPSVLTPELPPLHIGSLILVFGMMLGIGIVLTVTAGAVSAAVVNRYPVRPAFSTISGLVVVSIIPLVFLSWNRYPDSPLPILLATGLMASPLMIGWKLMHWWKADWSAFSVATNYVFSVILAFFSFGFIFTLLIWAIHNFFLQIAIDPAIVGASCSTAFIGLAILAACIARWKQPSGIAPIIMLGWHLVIVLATIYWVGYQEGGMTLWWIALYVIVILFFGFAFGNIDAAKARLWPEKD